MWDGVGEWDERVDRWMGGMDGTDGRREGWMNRWMDGCGWDVMVDGWDR